MDRYCPKCGNSGILLDGSPCDCRLTINVFNDSLSMVDVPDQYQGIYFDKRLICDGMSDYYRSFMDELYNNIISMKLKYKNYLICSPNRTSKTVMAYSALQFLFKRDIEVFPVYDLLEIKKITTDMDLNRKQTYTVDNPEKILTVPYLFVKIPDYLTNEVYQTMSVLVDRRTRRNTSTIFLYDGDLALLKKTDYQHLIDRLAGDGSYGTVIVKEFWKKETNVDARENGS